MVASEAGPRPRGVPPPPRRTPPPRPRTAARPPRRSPTGPCPARGTPGSHPWPLAPPPSRASISRACRAAARPAGSPRPTSSRPPRTAPRLRPAQPAGAQLLKGGAAALARYMDESRSIPTATSFRTLTVTVLDARRKELKASGRKVSFTHLIAYAIARAADDLPVMTHHFAEVDGKPHRVDDGQVNLGLAVDVEKKDGSRTLMVPVIRDAARLPFSEFLDAYDALVEKARTNTLGADDLVGGNVTLTNPGGLGTIASVPRLMNGQGTIVATGSIAYPVGLGDIGAMIGAEKVMTMTSTYDHRIIQGAESGRFLARVEDYLQGENGFYEGVFASLGVELGPQRRRRPPPAAAAAAAREAARRRAEDGHSREELMEAVQAATSLLKAFRTNGHLAARLDPLGTEPEGDPALDPEPLGPDPRADGDDPVAHPAHVRPRRDAGRRAAAPARDLLRHHRLRDRAHHLAPPARVAARAHRVRRLPRPADHRRAARAAAASRPRRRVRALHAQGVPRPEAVLDRGRGHDRPDARRADPARRRPRRPRGRHRHGPPRPAQRARPQPRPALRHDLRRVRGRLHAGGRHHDSAGRNRRREVPPRRRGLLPAGRRRVDPREPGVQPEPPGVRLAGGRRRHPGRADHAPGPARPPGHQRRGADHHPRRRRLPRPGRGGRDAQPAGARRLQGRRQRPPDHQQPGRLHHRSRRLALDALGVGPGQGLRRADHPRQRRRRRSLRERRSPGLRIPRGVRPRRAGRPHRLPPLRPQRGRRAGVHPAGDVREDQDQEACRRALGREADRRRRRHQGGGRPSGAAGLGQPDQPAPAA